MEMNPFITSGYAGAEYFCDRIKETQDIINLLRNGNNLALISPRRLGKTDLMRHCLSQPEIVDDYYTFIVDIYSASSLADVVNRMGKVILDVLKPKGKQVADAFVNVLRSVQSSISYDSVGMPSWSLSLGQIGNPSATLDEIFTYLNTADKPCVVVIDEFQQITKFADSEKVEAELRTLVQYCRNAQFVFSGSQRHLMGAMFTSPKRPFYQSVTLINLNPIARDVYREFCVEQFLKRGRTLLPEVVDVVYDRFDGVTFYMQKVMNILFMRTDAGEICGVDEVDAAVQYILDFSSTTYEDLLYQLPEKQKSIMIAICDEGVVCNITSADFVKRHHLVSASSVNSAVKALLDKDLITQSNGIYRPYDYFFAIWLRQQSE